MEPTIFTPETLNTLLTHTSINPEQAVVRTWDKKKNKRSSGEMLILPLPYSGTTNPEEIIQSYKNAEIMTEATDEDILKTHQQFLNSIPHSIVISMTHDKKSLSIRENRLQRTVNRHYPKTQAIFKNSYNDIIPPLYKQSKQGTDKSYLRSFIRTKSRALYSLPPKSFQTLTQALPIVDEDTGFITRILALYLNCSPDEAELEYNKLKDPVLTQFFPHITHKNYNIPGWNKAGDTTYTQVVTRSLEGFKPRKDLVRNTAKILNLKNSPPSLITVGNALDLTLLSKYINVGFDLEDEVVKILNSEHPFTLVSYVGGTDKNATLLNLATIISFLGPHKTKTMLRYYSEQEFNNLNALLGGPANSYTNLNHILQDTASMIKTLLDIPYIETRQMKRTMKSTSKNTRRETLQTLFNLSNPTGHNIMHQLEEQGYRETNSLQQIHDLLATHTRRYQPSRRNIDETQLHKEDPPIKEKVNTLPPLHKENTTYTFVYPERPADVRQWAESLNNCMSAYIQRVQQGDYTLIFVEKDKRPYAALGLNHNHKKNQFYRKNNIPLERQLETELLNHILE